MTRSRWRLIKKAREGGVVRFPRRSSWFRARWTRSSSSFLSSMIKLVVQKDIFISCNWIFDWIFERCHATVSYEGEVVRSRCSTKYNATEYSFLRCYETLSFHNVEWIQMNERVEFSGGKFCFSTKWNDKFLEVCDLEEKLFSFNWTSNYSYRRKYCCCCSNIRREIQAWLKESRARLVLIWKWSHVSHAFDNKQTEAYCALSRWWNWPCGTRRRRDTVAQGSCPRFTFRRRSNPKLPYSVPPPPCIQAALPDSAKPSFFKKRALHPRERAQRKQIRAIPLISYYRV